MRESEPDFETLSAYVDGELDAASAAHIAALAANDPRVAARVSKLHQLRAGVSALAGSDVVVATAVGRAPRGRFGALRWPAALAASLVLLVCAAALWFGTGEVRQGEGGLVATLVETHDEWLATGHARLAPAELPESPRSILLAAAGLIQVHADPSLDIGGVQVGHFGYVGANGCRLSLFELPVEMDGEVSDGLWASLESGLRLADWTSGSTHFIVVARDMNDQRFETVVGALRKATRERGATREMIARLESARQPCLS